MKERLSLIGLRVGFLEAYARELYRERSTSLFHLRVATEACSENTKPVPLSVKSLLWGSLIDNGNMFKRSSFVVPSSSVATHQ